MKMLCSVQLSKHRYKTPEGYLVCKDCIIARTGKQTYLKSELFGTTSENDEYIDVDRSPEQVFDEKTMSSFEGKPLTIEHPSESVNPENYKDLSVGNVHNVHRGHFEGQEVLYADINVYDAEAISLIESGEMVELSCGYDCDITSGPNPEQINIRGNHVALCEQGRAGIARIQDSKKAKVDIDRFDTLIKYHYFADKNNNENMKEFVNRLMVEYLPNDLSRQLNQEEKEYAQDKAKSMIGDSWGVKPVIKDSVQRGSLIQEFGRYGEQYKVVKIDGNVLYCEEVTTKKNTLFKKDKENVDWAIINKSQLNDEIPSKLALKFEEEIKEFVNKLGDKLEDVTFDYTSGYIPREHKAWVILVPYNSEYKKVEEGSYDYASEDRVLDMLKEEFKKAGYNSFIENNHGHIKVYQPIQNIKDAKEEKFAPNDYSDEFTTEELDEFVRKQYDKKYAENKDVRERKKKVFINKQEKEDFLKSLPESAEPHADEFDNVFPDDRYLVYWEVYYWGDAVKDAKQDKDCGLYVNGELIKNSAKAWTIAKQLYKEGKLKEFSELWIDEFGYSHDTDMRGVLRRSLEDSKPEFIIALEDEGWLDEYDHPTQDKEKARKFEHYDEAKKHQKLYCKGKVVKIQDTKIKDIKIGSNDQEEVKKLLEGINFNNMSFDPELHVIDLWFEDRATMRKAARILNSNYDLELDEEDGQFGITLYMKWNKPMTTIESTEDSNWFGYNIRKGKPAEEFKQYLRDRGMKFEPSENGEFVHFEILNADEDVLKEIKAINQHYTKVGLYDGYSKRFYTKMIKYLQGKLEKLEKNELLDSNQEDYQIQKNNMRKEIEKQIKGYKEKLNATE